jgi:hypothetical protein
MLLETEQGGTKNAAYLPPNLASIAHKPWKKEHSLFCPILAPLHTEPLLSGSIARKSHERFGS